MNEPYPFSAIVGQEEMKQAIILSTIDPSIGGVLVFGDRGTGKSTAVRALSSLLPKIKVVKGCPFNCEDYNKNCPHCKNTKICNFTRMLTPVVDLPLGVTEDRVLGSLDIEIALIKGKKTFEPGLLANAHRGFLYIDEVNLLDDHIVDLLLDVAASGENLIERDGISVRHQSKFVLVGSGNPEEGELRPQLLDRFGLSVEVASPKIIEDRVEVIKRRNDFENDKESFLKKWTSEDEKLRKKIVKAKLSYKSIEISEEMLKMCAELCLTLGADGLRGELTLIRSIKALAAYRGNKKAEKSHLKAVASSALRHRLRRDPLDETGTSTRVEKALNKILG